MLYNREIKLWCTYLYFINQEKSRMKKSSRKIDDKNWYKYIVEQMLDLPIPHNAANVIPLTPPYITVSFLFQGPPCLLKSSSWHLACSPPWRPHPAACLPACSCRTAPTSVTTGGRGLTRMTRMTRRRTRLPVTVRPSTGRRAEWRCRPARPSPSPTASSPARCWPFTPTGRRSLTRASRSASPRTAHCASWCVFV